MKKLFLPTRRVASLLALVMALTLISALSLSLAACGGGDKKANINDKADELVDEAVSNNSFSEAAANAWLKKNAGLSKTDIEPDFPYRIDESLMTTYGDAPSSSYGHASIMFIAEDDELTGDEWLEWMRKVFDATAKVSDDGCNIYGFEGDEKNPNGEISFDEAMGIGSDAWIVMQGWSYRLNGIYMHVYVDRIEDPAKESEAEMVNGQMTIKYYYYAGKVDVAVALQKSFDDTMSDAEKAFEENEDEIREALEG